MLTPDQQRLVEEAIKIVPVCVASYKRALPWLRKVMRLCDLESAAYLACCKAARTYDPNRGVGISAYFSVAIRNAMSREISNEIRSGSTSIARIPLLESDARVLEAMTTIADDPVFSALGALTEQERSWIERHVFDGTSYRAFGRESNCDPRTAKRRLRAHLDKLRDAYEDSPGHRPD